MSELCKADHVSARVLHEAELPIARLRVHYTFINNCLMNRELLPVNRDPQGFLRIVAHERELNLEGLWATFSCWSIELVWLLGICTSIRREN